MGEGSGPTSMAPVALLEILAHVSARPACCPALAGLPQPWPSSCAAPAPITRWRSAQPVCPTPPASQEFMRRSPWLGHSHWPHMSHSSSSLKTAGNQHRRLPGSHLLPCITPSRTTLGSCARPCSEVCRWHNHCSQKGSCARSSAACPARSLEHTVPMPPRTRVHLTHTPQACTQPAAGLAAPTCGCPPTLARPPHSPLQSTMRPGRSAQQGPCCWVSAPGHPWKEPPSCLQTPAPPALPWPPVPSLSPSLPLPGRWPLLSRSTYPAHHMPVPHQIPVCTDMGISHVGPCRSPSPHLPHCSRDVCS